MVVASNVQRNLNPRGTAEHPQSHFIHMCYVTGGAVEGGTAPLCLCAQMDERNVFKSENFLVNCFRLLLYISE